MSRNSNFVANGIVVHNSNARYVFVDGVMYCGSRTEWKREHPTLEHLTVESLIERGVPADKAADVVEKAKNKPQKKNLWWYALERCPAIETFCRANPGMVLYGEVFGRQGKLKYTNKAEEVFFAAFDVLDNGRWLDACESRLLLEKHGVPCVPLLNERNGDEIIPIPFDFAKVTELAEGQSMWEGSACIREGIVVKPMKERHDRAAGRVNLKCVSASYLERCR